MDLFMQGFADILNPFTVGLVLMGTIVGIIFGSVPGLTAVMAIALFLPITFGLGPIDGMALLMALYIGGVSGGLISAILINIPGTPASVATCFDGAPMARNGQGFKALGVGTVFSFIGTIFSVVALAFIAPWLATVALKFGPWEYFAVAVFSLTLISGLAGKSLVKGLISAVLGFLFTTVGVAPIDSIPRYTFGLTDFRSGFNILTVLIGLYAISEILATAANKNATIGKVNMVEIGKGFGFTWKEFFEQKWNCLRSALIGIGIGILPGIGGATSNILAYSVARSQSRYPEKFGTGIIDGIVASETANNATVGGAMIPMMCLGIPGDAATAMLLGGLIIHGLTPGPLLFVNSADVVYSVFASMILASCAMLAIQMFGLRVFAQVLRAPKHYLLPVVMVLCVVGAFGLNNRIFDIWSILIFGLVGFAIVKMDIPGPPMILGFVLGGMVETNLRRGLMHSNGSIAPLFTQPIPCAFMIITIVSVFFIARKNIKTSLEASRKAKAALQAAAPAAR